MQMKVITLAIPALAMFAFAQTQDPSQTRQPDTSGQQQTTTQQDTRTETESGTTMSGQEPVRQSRTGEPTTAKPRTYKGTLVDASCAQNMARTGMTGQPTAAERSATTAEEAARTAQEAPTTAEEAARTAEEQVKQRTETGASTTGTASRVDAKAVSQSCPITSTTTDFALVLNDGRLVQLDQQGDAKVTSELKTNNKWNKAINENKRITASVKGVLQGDTLQVESVK
jgi:hypothetical protein